MPSLPSYPALAPQDAISSSTSYAASESYYSNEDIRILHDVVDRAQEILFELPEGERLATNALFRAYDEVLPLHGVDPEQDQHISRLVFRIGGERGDGSLFEKFKSVLSRMGIEVEIDFDSDNPTSSPGAHSDKSTTTSVFLHTHSVQNQLAETGRLSASPLLFRATAPPRSSGLLQTKESPVLDPRSGDGTKASNIAEPSIGLRNLDINHVPGRITSLHASQAIEASTAMQHSLHNPRDNFPDVVEQSEVADSFGNTEGADVHRDPGLDDIPRSEAQEMLVDPHDTMDSQRLGRRASRAWNLFQLTKAISHWAICTEEKMERTAVARRHILRIRHFGPWAQLTAEAKLSSRRISVSRIENAWASLARNTCRQEQDALKLAARNLFRRVAREWTVASSSDATFSPLSSLRVLKMHQWQACLSETEVLDYRARRTWEIFLFSKVTLSWRRSVAVQSRDAAFFARNLLFWRSLNLWDLAVRSQRFLHLLQRREVHAWLGEWHQLLHPPGTRPQEPQHEQHRLPLRPLLPDDSTIVTSCFDQNMTAMVLRRWQQKARSLQASGEYYRDIRAQNVMAKTLSTWSSEIEREDEVSRWAIRAERFFGLTKTLQHWQWSLPRWDSVTRRAYVKCRWRQKALITRRQLFFWRTSTRDLDSIAQSTRRLEVGRDTRRATKTLDAWKEVCQELVSKEWPLHLYAIWLDEWIVALEGSGLMEQESRMAWNRFLTSRVWSKWHSMSVQLHSHHYIVEEVAGKNARKSTHRVLQHWKNGGSSFPGDSRLSTLVGSSIGPSRASRNYDTSLWSRSRSGQTAASSLLGVSRRTLVKESDEDQDTDAAISEGDEMGGLIDTPSRWTGLGSSLAKLPSTTPLAPLSTPFERELRNRYNPNARRSLGVHPGRFSVRATPRLSATEARRIAEERRRGSRIGGIATTP
ncbi:hypothetical protein SODALDRAFT_327550 [Sodiomyces alkalinus F11]|uniref:Sfi1 spindle body domain-containing protein n=1 Tax=Sodiomyces alkalinus (strain CBS 110278 / VKM F-3762 / F11) TaxID=1314773 RepID=A0A3N2Q9H7_SODAK|nr:hypothetical protein SODALDRAFT_327550 [Sodiomyces alkalinus F11]ROT43357.1 hypothetical protein SODALDRAFT_327550 [Sodiomyces alkalinus F11]